MRYINRFLVIVAATSLFTAQAMAQTLQTSLDATNLTWTTKGTFGALGWTGETSVTHDGTSAAQSGTVSGINSSILQTTVTGPGTLTFWCYAPDSQSSLVFTAGTVTEGSFNLMTSWQQQVFYIGSGAQTLTWTYTNTFGGASAYPAYLDQVSWVTGSTVPIITNQPVSQSQVQGLNATFSLGVAGTPPFTYQWYFNSNAITGATSISYTVTNVQATNLGYYSVAVTNATGGTNSTIASLEFGNVTGWGANGFFQTSIPPGTTNVLAVSAGGLQNLALKSDGTLLAWGLNNAGQQPIPPDLSNIVAVGANSFDSMAITAGGSLIEWGDNSYSQTNVAGSLSNVVAVASGAGSVNMFLQSDGTASSAGPNFFGQTNVPPNLSNVVAVAAGSSVCMALKSDGTVTVWGSQPNLTNVPPDLSNAVAIATGSFHCLALKSDGTVEAWGSNSSGVTNVPPGLSNVVAIAAGSGHSLALKADGSVVAWGSNAIGQTNVPAGLSNVVAIAAGANYSIALVGSSPPVVSASIQNPTLSGNSFSFSIPSQSGRIYALEYKNNITDPTWTPLPLVAGNGANLVMTDTTATNSQRFYRVRRW
jgi:hypothetical protein